MQQKFIQQLIVEKEHLDELEHVNNVLFLRWSQDIAKSHWEFLIEPLTEKIGVWMVRKHEVEYRLEAKENEIIRVETHVNSVRGPLSNRVVEFYNNETQKLLVKCQTQWCYIDLVNKKTIPIPESIRQLFLGDNAQ